MKVYRLKHKPTGLYFTPSRGSGNLSIKGKLYPNRKPDISWTKVIRIVLWDVNKNFRGKAKTIIDCFGLHPDTNYIYIYIYMKTSPDDWEIEEVS